MTAVIRYDICPICERPPVQTCRCKLMDSVCPNGHHWHMYQGRVHQGHANHASPHDHSRCLVVVPGKLPQRFTRSDNMLRSLQAAAKLKLQIGHMAWLRGIGVGETEKGEPTVEVRVQLPLHLKALPREVNGVKVNALAIGDARALGGPRGRPTSTGAAPALAAAEYKDGYDTGVADGRGARASSSTDPKVLRPNFDITRTKLWQEGYTAGYVDGLDEPMQVDVKVTQPQSGPAVPESPVKKAMKWGLGLTVVGGAAYAAYQLLRKPEPMPHPTMLPPEPVVPIAPPPAPAPAPESTPTVVMAVPTEGIPQP